MITKFNLFENIDIDPYGEEKWETQDDELMSAAHDLNVGRVKTLLDNGADPNKSKDSSGHTPLMYCVIVRGYNLSTDIVKLLIEHGADPNIQTNHGYTALMYVSDVFDENPSPYFIKYLIEHGADFTLKNDDGKDFYDLAPMRLKKLLQKNSLDVDGYKEFLESKL